MAITLDYIDKELDGIEDRVNENYEALSPAAEFARHKSASTALTLALYGGISPLTGNTVAASTHTLTGSATNYVSLKDDDSIEVVTVAPSGWPYGMTGKWAIGTGVAGSSTYTWTDVRRIGGSSLAVVLALLGITSWSYDGTNITITMTDSKQLLLGPFS